MLPSSSAVRHPAFALACALALAGCARDAAKREARHEIGADAVRRPARVHDNPEQHQRADLRNRLPDAALLSPQPTPDCEFKGANVETMDASELARLKVEYERRCYQNAEKVARDRLGVLQDAVQNLRD
jgi:hypothetical protein